MWDPSGFGVLLEMWDPSAFGFCVELFGFSVSTGTRVIPHFGHFPGASITTSGCIGQVYFCEAAFAFAISAIAAAINKIGLFIVFPERSMGSPAGMSGRAD